ncbi:MAG: methionyl-tRNA formyltransferase [Firmicutes bacterium]|nr:methionyl-tRNA formyltransferase [Bacillota bacterium]
MRVLFMGSATFAVPILEALCADDVEVVGVVTQPDRPRGRGRQPSPTPVKVAAQRLQLPLLEPPKIRAAQAISQVAATRPELIVTAAYGQIIPPALLDLPVRGCVNVHPSLLPKYRGAAPIQRALWAGETETGVSIVYMTEQVDAGAILAQQVVPIDPDENTQQLGDRLARLGAALLIATLPALRAGTAKALPQEDRLATLAPKISPEEEWIVWEQPARQVHNQVRALSLQPAAKTRLGEKVVQILQTQVVEERATTLTPGQVQATHGRVLVGCLPGTLLLQRVKPAGRQEMEAWAWVQGLRQQTFRFQSGPPAPPKPCGEDRVPGEDVEVDHP